MADVNLNITIPDAKVNRLRKAFKTILNKDNIDDVTPKAVEGFIKSYIITLVKYVESQQALAEINNSIEDII